MGTQSTGLDQMDPQLQLAAAVSTTFDPVRYAEQPVRAINALAAVCEEVGVAGVGHRQWQMRGDARRAVLRSLKKQPDFPELLSTVDIPEGDRFATYLVDGLAGADLSDPVVVPSDGASSAVDLDDLLQAVRLLDDLSGSESHYGAVEQDVRRQIAVNDADDALKAVMPERLIGRDDHLQQLSEYCVREWPWDSSWVPTLVIEGLGGAGKSALVSTFIYTMRQNPWNAPLVYFDFDRARLIDARPVDLTIEFTRQLGLADATLEPVLAEFRERSQALLSDSDPSVEVDTVGGTAAAALRDLGSVLDVWPLRGAPLTIVLDTFEEVAIRGYTAVWDVLKWAADLRDAAYLPQLRLVVCGRAVFPDAPHLAPEEVRAMFNEVGPPLYVGDLSDDDATTLLIDLGVEVGTAIDLPPVFGGNPLVLKLLHRFVAANDDAAVAQLLTDGQAARRQSPTAEIGLRFVYERILKRIENPVVQALAYPGVVLRRVTPDLILQVLALASTIPLEVETEAQARRAFAELAQHVWLVSRVGDDVVEHRADVRRLLVPGLEASAEIDARRIHMSAAAYYSDPPPSVDPRTAWVEENYHLGFLDANYMLPAQEAEAILRALGPDLDFWPLRMRAQMKSWAGRHETLTEEEVASLDWDDQYTTRGARMAQYRSKGDVGHSSFEETQLDLAARDAGVTTTIPDSRWVLLFDRGEFEFMRDSARSLHTVDRFFASQVGFGAPPPGTHAHPWFITLASLMLNTREDRLLSEHFLSVQGHLEVQTRLYAAALTAIAGDREGHSRIVESLDLAELQGHAADLGIPERVVKDIDDVIILQAASSDGGLRGLRTRITGDAYDLFRLSHLSEIARATGDPRASERLAAVTEQYARERPTTGDLNRLRVALRQETPRLILDATSLRAAPTPLAFLYGAVRATLDELDEAALLEVIGGIENQSVFWPSDQTAEAIGTMSAGLSPTTITGLIETADRCGLLVDLVDAAASRAGTRLGHQLVAGIRRLEHLLFPFAKPRGDLPSFQ